MKLLFFLNIIVLGICSCSQKEDKNPQLDFDDKKVKCNRDITDTIGKDIFRIIKNDSCNVIFRSEFTFSNNQIDEYYYNQDGRLILLVKKTDSSRLNILMDEIKKDNFIYSYEAGKAIYNEYLSSFFGLNDNASEGDICTCLKESRESFDEKISVFFKDYYNFRLSNNELTNLRIYVESACFRSPL